jgi:lipopolysaccharide export system protein LptA
VQPTFRQKRDGAGEQWVEGQADRIEYTDKTDLVKLFAKAEVRRLEGTRLSDKVTGEFISYDSRKEFFAVKNNATGDSKPGAGRGTMVIQPSNKTAPAPADPAPTTTPGK